MKSKNLLNTHVALMLALIAVVLAAAVSGCSSAIETGKSRDSGLLTVERGEHNRDSGEAGGEHVERNRTGPNHSG